MSPLIRPFATDVQLTERWQARCVLEDLLRLTQDLAAMGTEEQRGIAAKLRA